MSLDGLAKVLGQDADLRTRLLETGSLMAWPEPRLTGITKNVDCIRMNAHLLEVIANFWCPQWTGTRMIPIDDIKEEALVY